VTEDPFHRSSLSSGVFYKNPWAALDWLEKAFGFERSMVITDKDGNLGHSEMRFGDSTIYVGSEWADFVASPASVGEDAIVRAVPNARICIAEIGRLLDGHDWLAGEALGQGGGPCRQVKPCSPCF
jgi:hypothetical protein